MSIESNIEDLHKDIEHAQQNKSDGLNENEINNLCLWIKNELVPVVSIVKISRRLSTAPAVIVTQFPSSMKTYLHLMDKEQLDQFRYNHTLEINPNHKLIVGINELRKTDSLAASRVLKQLLDNTLLSCGLLIDTADFVDRVNSILEKTVQDGVKGQAGSEPKEAPTSESTSSSSGSNLLNETLKKMQEQARSEAREGASNVIIENSKKH